MENTRKKISLFTEKDTVPNLKIENQRLERKLREAAENEKIIKNQLIEKDLENKKLLNTGENLVNKLKDLELENLSLKEIQPWYQNLDKNVTAFIENTSRPSFLSYFSLSSWFEYFTSEEDNGKIDHSRSISIPRLIPGKDRLIPSDSYTEDDFRYIIETQKQKMNALKFKMYDLADSMVKTENKHKDEIKKLQDANIKLNRKLQNFSENKFNFCL